MGWTLRQSVETSPSCYYVADLCGTWDTREEAVYAAYHHVSKTKVLPYVKEENDRFPKIGTIWLVDPDGDCNRLMLRGCPPTPPSIKKEERVLNEINQLFMDSKEYYPYCNFCESKVDNIIASSHINRKTNKTQIAFNVFCHDEQSTFSVETLSVDVLQQIKKLTFFTGRFNLRKWAENG